MKLLETFKGFDFITKEFNNLKKDEILTMLEDIPKTFGVDYDCIFVCILSHGYEGMDILNYFSNYVILYNIINYKYYKYFICISIYICHNNL